jgi:hypothetical protein
MDIRACFYRPEMHRSNKSWVLGDSSAKPQGLLARNHERQMLEYSFLSGGGGGALDYDTVSKHIASNCET